MKNKKNAFTLIEMLIVIVAVGLLTIALVPKLQNSLARTRNSKRQVDLKNLYNGLKVYSSDHSKFPAQTNQLVGTYINGLPSDPSKLEACVNKIDNQKYATSIQPKTLSPVTLIDSDNYYDLDKGYYYNVLDTGNAVPGRDKPDTPPVAIIGAYMEKVASNVSVSNVPYSSQTFYAQNPTWIRGWGCPEYAIRSIAYGVSAAAGLDTEEALPDPESLNTPEVTERIEVILQTSPWNEYYDNNGNLIRFDVTEGDYLMMVAR